jgi:hypothetical protein
MAKVFIEETTLTAIGDAIRGKEGSTELVPVNDMATRISAIEAGGGGYEPTAEDLTFTGACNYLFAGDNWNFILEQYPGKVNLVDATNLNYAFSSSSRKDFSMLTVHTKNATMHSAFGNSINIEKLPKVAEGSTVSRYLTNIFSGCRALTDDEINNFITSFAVPSSTDTQTGYNAMMPQCYSVRDLTPTFDWLDAAINTYSGTSTSYTNYSQALYALYALDKMTNMYVPRVGGARTSNAFSAAFAQCYRLSDLIFKTDNGTPYSVNWKNQTIDITDGIGYSNNTSYLFWNSGITSDKEVKDDATYQALKNDPDWFTFKEEYSRYNHDSAVRTINSLPDTSAYLASAGGTNTIKFKGTSGSATDGGAINTLTAEEIAVATAKGWTVTLV